jgi:transposase
MEQLLKQSIGIDIAKKDFTACLASSYSTGQIKYSSPEVFDNNKKGFNQFLKWSNKVGSQDILQTYIMESTGVYYEPLAYHLHRISKYVSVLLPNKVKHFAKSLNVKTKTDAVDAKILARFGVERHHIAWHPPKEIFKRLRELTRLYGELKKERTIFLNRSESLESSELPSSFVLKVNRKLIRELENQIGKCEQEIKNTVDSDSWLKEKVRKLETIKGLGFITVAIIVAETQGFALIQNRKQLASYAGYDVVQRESGTSVKGKTRISKKGNSRIRASLHFPALVASRHDLGMKKQYHRINQNKTSKMVGATAVQRKLLLLTYTLWKNDDVYRENIE